MWVQVFFGLTTAIENENHFQLQMVEGFLFRKVGLKSA